MTWLSTLSFGAPWILAALIALPAIWWLLRVTPPAPRRLRFAPLRLLQGLRDKEKTPARTPWWLLLLRLLAAALVILALAEPLVGRAPLLSGKGPLVLLVDNGWTAAPHWAARRALMDDLLRGAAGRGVVIMASADAPDRDILDTASARRRVRALMPRPWLPDRHAAAQAIAHMKFAARPQIVWLSDGIEDGHAQNVAQTLSRNGDLKIYGDRLGPLALLPPVHEANGYALTAMRAAPGGARSARIAAIGRHGETLATAMVHFRAGENRAKAHLALPLEIRNQIARFAIPGQNSAGAVQLTGSGNAIRRVGLVSASSQSEQPLLSDVYYLERALGPYAQVQKGTIADLVAHHVAVLVLADIGKIGGSDYTLTKKFVADGGVLIRFAGPRMAVGSDDLVPVKLRSGGRYLGSAMAWAKPQHLAPFDTASPFAGLTVPPDVTVSRQILAEPSVALSSRSWARLADGTPLVTAQQNGRGWIVLFHVTAGPAWSSLPLSGLYVDMLRRMLALASGANAHDLAGLANLPPVATLDGFGRTHTPPAEARPIAAAKLGATDVSPSHPPGLYGAHGVEMPLNAVKPGDVLLPLGDLGRSVTPYAGSSVLALQPALLGLALLLIMIDALIALGLRGHGPRLTRIGAALLLGFAVFPVPHARADDAWALQAALHTHLAYVETGLADVDAMSKAGLTGLGMALRQRTSYEPPAPMGVDIAHDDLAFFPLLYWPMDPREKDLSPQAISKISAYMHNGGIILFDTRDLTLGGVRGPQSPGVQTLRRLTAKLDLPPLEVAPPDHVLTKTFYILHDFPGRWAGGKVWIEALPPAGPDAGPVRGGDGVSPVIIGGNDWAGAWAVDAQGHPLVDVMPGGARQREMAIRFGINVVMYALTGNYKADQVHAPAILERMGK
jgi:hypothetical protein